MWIDNKQASPPVIQLGEPDSGLTALTVSNLVASNNQDSPFDIGMAIAGAIPNEDVSRAVSAVSTISNAAKAANQGSMLGVGMALAGAVPGSDFSDAMSKVKAVSSAISAANQGSPMSAAMALAGISPDSQYAQVMNQIAQSVDVLKQGMAVLNPSIDPTELISHALAKVNNPAKSVNITAGPPGARVKGEGIKCKACALANQEAMVGAPVQALYGSKVLIGGDDIDYSGTGYLPFVLSRVYNSQNTDIGWFGQGWTTQGFEQRLELDPQHNRIYLIDNSGRRVPFTYLAPGQSCYQPVERITLYRKPIHADKKHTTASSRPILADATNGSRIGEHEPLEFIIYRGQYTPSQKAGAPTVDRFEGIAQHYSYVAKRSEHGTYAEVLLSSYADKYGHHIQLHYTRDNQSGIAHIPQYITEDAGACYELELSSINEQIRLSGLYLIDSTHRQDNPDSIPRIALAQYQYNDDGDLIEVTQKRRITRTFGYQNHLMVAQSQPNGQQAIYRYDQYEDAKSARVVEHGISSGRHYLFDYDIDSNGIKSTTVIEQPGSEFERTRRFEYDDWYNLLSTTDYLGNTTHFEVDDNNRTIKVTRADGSHTNFNYQGNHLASVQIQTSISSLTKLPTYRETSYQYNHLGKVIAVTDSLGNTQHFTYNARGELESQTDALGNTTTFTYDNHGNITSQTLANGSKYTFEYDEVGNLTIQTDCSGYQTHYAYDDKQRLRRITDAMGQVTEHYYNDSKPHLEHLLTQVKYPDGSHIQMDYDEKGRLIKYTDAKGHTVKYDYSADGQPTRREETSAESTDAISVKRLNESGQALAYTYDILGRLSKLTNENGETWTFSFDANDNLTYETRFDGHQSQYYYNSLGQMTHQIDNPQLSKVYQHHIHNEYNLAGELINRHSCHYPDIINTADIQTHKSDKPEYLRVHYNYDLDGRLLSVSNPNSRINFDYDPAGRLIKETLISHLTGQHSVREHTLTHNYDELGNRTKTMLPDGKVINQLYYGSGHLYNQSLYDPTHDRHIELRHSERNKRHQEISRQQGVLHTSFHYDPMGRLLKQQSGTDNHISIERHYHYDVLGHLTHLSGHSTLGTVINSNPIKTTPEQFRRNHQYEYDSQGRLTQHKLTDYQSHSGITELFAFDPASNRVPVQPENAESDKTGQQQTPTTTGRPTELIHNGERIRYTYDSHGRMLYKTKEAVDQPDRHKRTALHLQYNANNEVVKSLTREYQGNKVKQTITNYQYDVFSRRIAKHSEIRQLTKDGNTLKAIQKPSYQHTHMLWDGDKLIQEYSDNHVFTTVYDQASFAPVARLVWLREETINEQISEQDKDWLTKFNNKERETRVNLREIPSFYNDYVRKDKLEDILGIKVYHYHNDQLGTPNELTNEKGEVIWLADLAAWGNISKEEYQSQAIGDFEISAEELQPIRFQGQSLDSETGLHYNRFRYYDPDMGMFISRDPIGLMGGDNVFAYAPNPTGWVDPLGLSSFDQGFFGVPSSQYSNMAGLAKKQQYDYLQKEKTSSASSFRKNKTIMNNVSATGRVIAGVELGVGWGASYDKNGIPSQCYVFSPCLTGGAEERLSGGYNRSVTDSASPSGWSYTNQQCITASAVAGVGPTAGVCTGSDNSTTTSGGVSYGEGGGVSTTICRPLMYCKVK